MDQSDRQMAIDNAAEDRASNGSELTMQVSLKGQVVTVPVVTVHPNILILNHDNFRIASQLQDSNRAQAVLADPVSDSSQKEIETHLRKTKEFPDLLVQLKEYGQQEPGLISATGLLINGNTRAVALRKLGFGGMQVGVLPQSANNRDLVLIQASLQMRKWVHQDYSFTNELLFLEDFRKNLKLEDKSIVRELGWKPGKASENKLETKFRLLELIREVRTMATKPVPYSFFDDKQQSLEDLDKEYQKEKNVDLQAAENLKIIRLMAIVRGLTKDQVRAIDKDLANKEVEAIAKPAADEHDIFGARSPRDAFKKTVDSRFDDEGNSVAPSDKKEQEDAKRLQVAAENEINQKRLRNLLDGPNAMLADAIEKLEKTCFEAADQIGASDFDIERYSEHLEKIQELHVKLVSLRPDAN